MVAGDRKDKQIIGGQLEGEPIHPVEGGTRQVDTSIGLLHTKGFSEPLTRNGANMMRDLLTEAGLLPA